MKKKLIFNTYTGKRTRMANLIPYVDLEGIIKYSSKTINVYLPSGEWYPICKSILEKYGDQLLYVKEYNAYLILGATYSLPPSSKYNPSSRVYTLDNYNKELTPYSELNNDDFSFLAPYTFGFELETNSSYIAEEVAAQNGFATLYDGSINGKEYTSMPMNYKNFHHLHLMLDFLKTAASHDSTCSFHCHIGSVKYSDENLKSIYSLFQRLQEDLNLLIAPYKKNYSYLAAKNKDHCQNLPLIDYITSNKVKELF
jgi:hypothetical protein